jgi:hypothetical protein
MALEEVTQQPPFCWFRYMDNTITIWPQGSDKLINFCDHLNSVQKNIQFTTKTGKDSHRSSLILTFTVNLMALWQQRLPQVNIYQPQPQFQPNRQAVYPRSCTKLLPLVTVKACMMRYSFSELLSGRIAVMTGRSDRF